jgi:hypothetical protein
VSRRPFPPAVAVIRALVALVLSVVATLAAASVAAQPAAAAAAPKTKAKKPVAKVTLTQAKASGRSLALRGRVTLPLDSAQQRRRTRVAFTLKDAKGRTERFAVAIDARRGFRVTRTTKLSGRLALTARVALGGRGTGATLRRTLTVKVTATQGGGGGTVAPGGGGQTPGPGGGGPAAPGPDAGTPLVGLFKLDAGVSHANGRYSGSFFRMLTPTGAYLTNNNSTARDITYTLLAPGTDGGLKTDGFQEATDPAFASDPATEAGAGGRPNVLISLSSRIVRPQQFFFASFGIVTGATDKQFGTPGVLPQIVNRGGTLSGQLSGWVVGWNGNWFNQGTPKPAGAPALSEYGLTSDTTTPLRGTYDAASGRYVLQWRSLIVSGPFNGFTGEWRIEGTFVPAG